METIVQPKHLLWVLTVHISHILYFYNRAKWAIIVIICPFRGTREIRAIICPLKQHH